MEQPEPDRRSRVLQPQRTPFGTLVRVAIRNRIRESRAPDVFWKGGNNLGWVRWICEDGRFAYCGVRRKNGWITGEVGVALEPLELDELKLVHAVAAPPDEAFRIQLGMLLHGQEKWWSFGGTEKGLCERLDWLAQQMHLRMYGLLSSSAPPRT